MWRPFKRFRHDGAEKPRQAPRLASGGGGDLPPPPDHDAFRAADPYAFEVAHRRLAWVTRLMTMGFVASVSLNLVLGGAVSSLVPLQRLQLGLVRIEASTDRATKVDPAAFVRVLPITKDAPGYDLMMESFVRRYVRLLLEIDTASQADRLREANLYSDAEFWKKFISDRYPEMKKVAEAGLDRSVVIHSSSKISERAGVHRYLIAFDQVDSRAGRQTETKTLHAYIAIAARPHTVRESEKYENPLGLRVLDLSVKVRGNS